MLARGVQLAFFEVHVVREQSRELRERGAVVRARSLDEVKHPRVIAARAFGELDQAWPHAFQRAQQELLHLEMGRDLRLEPLLHERDGVGIDAATHVDGRDEPREHQRMVMIVRKSSEPGIALHGFAADYMYMHMQGAR